MQYSITTRNIISEVGGENGAERGPPPGIQAQRPRARTARATRQINGAKSFGGYADFGEKCSTWW